MKKIKENILVPYIYRKKRNLLQRELAGTLFPILCSDGQIETAIDRLYELNPFIKNRKNTIGVKRFLSDIRDVVYFDNNILAHALHVFYKHHKKTMHFFENKPKGTHMQMYTAINNSNNAKHCLLSESLFEIDNVRKMRVSDKNVILLENNDKEDIIEKIKIEKSDEFINFCGRLGVYYRYLPFMFEKSKEYFIADIY